MEDTMIAAIDHKHSNSCPFLRFSSVAEKNWPFSWGYSGSWGHACREVAVHGGSTVCSDDLRH